MEKNIKLSILCQIYGKILTDKQLIFLEDYYNNDLSLSEIAENNNITRQAVRDVIKQGENKLLELENKLGIMKKNQELEKNIAIILKDLESLNEKTSDEKIKKDIQKIKEQIKKLF